LRRPSLRTGGEGSFCPCSSLTTVKGFAVREERLEYEGKIVRGEGSRKERLYQELSWKIYKAFALLLLGVVGLKKCL